MNKSDRFTKLPPGYRKFGRCQPGSTFDAASRETDKAPQDGARKTAPQRKMGLKKAKGAPEGPGRSPKAKFRVFGEELIEKVVKANGNSGRVYLPPSWVGKHVKIIRTD